MRFIDINELSKDVRCLADKNEGVRVTEEYEDKIVLKLLDPEDHYYEFLFLYDFNSRYGKKYGCYIVDQQDDNFNGGIWCTNFYSGLLFTDLDGFFVVKGDRVVHAHEYCNFTREYIEEELKKVYLLICRNLGCKDSSGDLRKSFKIESFYKDNRSLGYLHISVLFEDSDDAVQFAKYWRWHMCHGKEEGY